MKKLLFISLLSFSLYGFSQTKKECIKDYNEGLRDGRACAEGLISSCGVKAASDSKCYSWKSDGYIKGYSSAKRTEYHKLYVVIASGSYFTKCGKLLIQGKPCSSDNMGMK